MTQAACRGVYPKRPGDPDIFFPRTREQEAEAIAKYCFRCQVKTKCDNRRQQLGATWGIWRGAKIQRT